MYLYCINVSITEPIRLYGVLVVRSLPFLIRDRSLLHDLGDGAIILVVSKDVATVHIHPGRVICPLRVSRKTVGR